MGIAILHAGMHKTGSSSIQETLYALRHDLPEHHFFDAGHSNASGLIQFAFRDVKHLQYQARNKGDKFSYSEILDQKNRALERFAQQLHRAQKKNIIISAEDLATLSLSEMVELKAMTDRYYEDYLVVAYIRRPKAFMASAFQEILKFQIFEHKPITLQKPSYRERFEKFEQLFGKKALRYILFDRENLQDGCVVTDYCSRIGIEIRPNQIIRANEGLSLEAVKLLYVYRKYAQSPQGPRRDHVRLVKYLAKLSGAKLEFTDQFLAETLADIREDVHWMEERFWKGALEETDQLNDVKISCWADLERLQKSTLNWLYQQLGQPVQPQGSMQTVAQKMIELRDKLNVAKRSHRISTTGNTLAGIQPTDLPVPIDHAVGHEGKNNKAGDVALKIHTNDAPERSDHQSIDGGADKRAAIALDAFQEILTKLKGVEEGTMQVDGFGTFKILKVEVQQGAHKGQKVRRIIFLPYSAEQG